MKKLTALFTALFLALLSVLGIRTLLHSVPLDSLSFSAWANETKTKSRLPLLESFTENTLLVFGSSEFQHGTDTPYHPASLFLGTDCTPLLLGAGYYQSLSHSIALGSLSQGNGEVKPDRAVLILSPQWFRKPGVLPEAFATRFSETDYIALLKNPRISSETKTYIENRTQKLLSNAPKVQAQISSYQRTWDSKTACFQTEAAAKAREAFLEEKEQFSVPFFFQAAQLFSPSSSFPHFLKEDSSGKKSPDWDAYLRSAEEDGKKYQTNEFYIDDQSYASLKKILPSKKGISKSAVHGYGQSPEYDDLRCFLTLCQELSIEPLLVILPVNGYYYDYTGFPKEARERYYENIREIAREYKAETADFSGDEYTKYFFCDRVHLGRKGWVLVNEALYEFYKNGR